jgi:hypothetical protein
MRGYSAGITDDRDFTMYAIEMASGGMIYIPSVINVGSGIQMLIGEETQTHRQQSYLTIYFQNKKSGLKD